METQVVKRRQEVAVDMLLAADETEMRTERVDPFAIEFSSWTHEPIVVPPALQKTEAAVDPAETRTVPRQDMSRANWQPSVLPALVVLAVLGLAIGGLTVMTTRGTAPTPVMAQLMVVGLVLAGVIIFTFSRWLWRSCGKVAAALEAVDRLD